MMDTPEDLLYPSVLPPSLVTCTQPLGVRFSDHFFASSAEAAESVAVSARLSASTVETILFIPILLSIFIALRND